ncbi:MAG TPA: hypothetical protein VIE65_02820, partial [Methylobacter sp.]
LNDFIQLLSNYLPQFNINIGLEINFSCPNVDVDYYNLTDEIHQAVSIARKLNIPIIPNLSPDIPTRLALEIALSGCDAISIANTVKFGRASDKIDWKELWGNESPLKHLGGGGISGAPLLPLILKWGRHARNMGLKIPIILGGGIMSADDAKQVIETGASAIKLGVVGMLRPWRVRSIVKAAEALYLSQNSSP